MLDEIDRSAYERHPVDATPHAIAIIFHSSFSFMDVRPSLLSGISLNNKNLKPTLSIVKP
jgi:hypothetical protein